MNHQNAHLVSLHIPQLAPKPKDTRWIRWSVLLMAAVALSVSNLHCMGEVTVSHDPVYHYSAGRGEGLSVSKDGYRIIVSSPTDISASLGQPAETTFHSHIPFVNNLPRAFNVFNETAPRLDIGLIEAADVAVVHGQHYGLVAVRANRIMQPAPLPPLVPLSGALLAVSDDQVLQTLPITGRPDGLKASPDGRYAVVADEGGGNILVYDLLGGPGQIYLAARISRATLQSFYIGVPNPTGDFIEPESIGFAPDSSFALVTIQDSSSVAAIDMTAITLGQEQGGLTPEQIGDAALKSVVHLPHGFRNNVNTATGLKFRGVEPDGVAVSPDGSFAIVANESHQSAKHLQGLSVLDLRGGLQAIEARTYSIFRIDPSLLENTGLTEESLPDWSTTTYPTDANKLPRLDPTNVEIVKRGNQTIAVFVIERYNPSAAQLAASPNFESRGSVLFLDVSDALAGKFGVIDRVQVGVPASPGLPNTGATLEGIDTAQNGRWIFVSISNGGGDKGTVARLELINK